MTERAPRYGVAQVGPGDDCAVLAGGECVTVDTLVEGVHWNERLSPEDVGWKAVAVSVSDLAAMGADPRWMTLSLSLPSVGGAWLESFRRGLHAAASHWGVELIGGDTTGGSIRTVSITMSGVAKRPVLRSGARAGDQLFLTGWPGLAGAGWFLSAPHDESLRALRRPEPPLRFAVKAAPWFSSAMDLSDGLAADGPRLAQASRVGLVVDHVPTHTALADAPEHVRWSTGDDFQLLFTSRTDPATLILAGAEHGVVVHHIGHCVDGPSRFLGGDWPDSAFGHFAAEGT